MVLYDLSGFRESNRLIDGPATEDYTTRRTAYVSANQPPRKTTTTLQPIKTSLPATKTTDWLKWILIAIVVIIVVFTLWYVFVRRKGKKRKWW